MTMLASSSRHVLKNFTQKARVVRKTKAYSSGKHVTPEGSSFQSQRRHDFTTEAANKPRIRPWEFKREDQYIQYDRSSSLSRCNMQLQGHAAAGRAIEALKLCARMKRDNILPDLTTYNCLIRALGRNRLYLEAWAAFNDMKAIGIVPDNETFNQLIWSAHFIHPHATLYLLALMREHGLEPDVITYSHVIRRYAAGSNLELSLQHLVELNAKHSEPTLLVEQAVIELTTEFCQPRLALDLAEAFEGNSIRRFDGEVWVKILVACADALWDEGVLKCWKKVVTDMNITPDEGLCLKVLHTAGRHGLPSLAAEVMGQLEALNVLYEDHHLEPLLEAFVSNGQIKEAFKVLELMRSNNLNPQAITAFPITNVIQRDPDSVDNAWALLHEIHSEGDSVDVVAVNVIIQASVFLSDLQRAVGTYKAMPEINVEPNIDTYNYLFEGCVRAKHRDLGEKLLAEMKDLSIKPNAETYETLINLCLTQPTYEDAFYFLEEMEGAGFVPSYAVYEALIRKCVHVGDVRYRTAVEELTKMGYQLSRPLKSFIDSGGEYESDKPQS